MCVNYGVTPPQPVLGQLAECPTGMGRKGPHRARSASASGRASAPSYSQTMVVLTARRCTSGRRSRAALLLLFRRQPSCNDPFSSAGVEAVIRTCAPATAHCLKQKMTTAGGVSKDKACAGTRQRAFATPGTRGQRPRDRNARDGQPGSTVACDRRATRPGRSADLKRGPL